MDLAYLPVLFFAFLATVDASKFSLAVLPLTYALQISTTQAGYLVCFPVLALGLGNIIWVPLAKRIGRRPIYILSLTILCGANVGSYFAPSFGVLLATSIVSGFAGSASQATVPAMVADLFFVHHRGVVMMFFHMALSCGLFLGPAITGYIVQESNWQMLCMSMAVASAVAWVFVVLFVHESSNYERNMARPEDSFGPRKTHFQRMGLSSGLNEDITLLTAFWNTLSVFAYPPVLWAGIIPHCSSLSR